MPTLTPCPQCKGAKTISVQISDNGVRRPDMVMPCMTCDGAGSVSPAAARRWKRDVEMWCSCGNPSGDVKFYADGERRDVRKHHYRCTDCGKVTQIG